MNFNQKLGQLIRQKRLAKGLSIAELSKLVGIQSHTYLFKVENGTKGLSLQRFGKMIPVLNICHKDIKELFNIK